MAASGMHHMQAAAASSLCWEIEENEGTSEGCVASAPRAWHPPSVHIAIWQGRRRRT